MTYIYFTHLFWNVIFSICVYDLNVLFLIFLLFSGVYSGKGGPDGSGVPAQETRVEGRGHGGRRGPAGRQRGRLQRGQNEQWHQQEEHRLRRQQGTCKTPPPLLQWIKSSPF